MATTARMRSAGVLYVLALQLAGAAAAETAPAPTSPDKDRATSAAAGPDTERLKLLFTDGSLTESVSEGIALRLNQPWASVSFRTDVHLSVLNTSCDRTGMYL
jgi:hypothetical protein